MLDIRNFTYFPFIFLFHIKSHKDIFHNGEDLVKSRKMTESERQKIYGYLGGGQYVSTARDIIAPVATAIILDKWANSKNQYLSEPVEGGTLNIGAGKNPTKGAYNIDFENSNPNIGVFKGDATDLSNIKTGSQSRVVIENTKKYDALNPEVIRVVEKGGVVEMTGNYSNSDFKRYYDMSPQELDNLGFEIVKKGNIPLEQAKQGYQTNGRLIPLESMKELILIKK